MQDGTIDALRRCSSAEEVANELLSLVASDCQVNGAAQAKPLAPARLAFLTNVLASVVGQIDNLAAEAGVLLMEYAIPSSANGQPAAPWLLDALLGLARSGAVHGGVPAALMEQVLEATPVNECAAPFGYLEAQLEAFRAPAVRQRASLTLQRACNTLLHRLSKSQDARLAGRVLLFLARLLPLMERSGVNLQGAFDAENATPVEEVEEGAEDSLGRPVDAAFYRSFWALQATFADPPSAVARWQEVRRGVRAALDRLREEPVALTEAAASSLHISAKYLSGPRLLSLQLRDATFRRHFLVQCLILFQFLRAPHPAKQAWPALKPRQLEDVQALEGAVTEALARTPEHGARFAASVARALREEEEWALWKQAGCPKEPFERPDAPPLAPLPAPLARPAKRRRPGPEAYYGVTLGTDELDRLWNLTEDNVSGLPAEDRGGFKTLGQLMEPVLDEMNDPDDSMDGGLSKSTTYSWRTLRAVSRVNLRAFVAAVQAGGDLQVAARVLYPSRCPPEPEPAGKPPLAPAEAKPGDGAGAADEAMAAQPAANLQSEDEAMEAPEPRASGDADSQAIEAPEPRASGDADFLAVDAEGRANSSAQTSPLPTEPEQSESGELSSPGPGELRDTAGPDARRDEEGLSEPEQPSGPASPSPDPSFDEPA